MADPYWIDPQRELSALDMARQRRAAYNRLANTLTADQSGYASQLLRRHPNLSAGLLQALAQAPQPQEIVDRLADEDDGGWFSRVRDGVGDTLGDVVGATTGLIDEGVDLAYEQVLKPAIRGAFVIADGLAQEVVQRPLTSVLAAARGEDDLAGAYRRYGDSALVNLATGDLDNDAEGGVLGTGFFAGGRAQAEADSERTLTINGQKATVGRAIANSTVGFFADPGDRAYDAVAGIAGFAVDVGLDPLAWLTGGTAAGARLAAKAGASARTVGAIEGGVTGAVRARGALTAGDAAGVLARHGGMDDILTAAGAVSGARRNTVLVEQASNFFRSKDLLGKLAEADEYTIAKSWKQSRANRLDGNLIRRLGAAKTEEEVAAHLLDAVAHGDVTQAGVLRGSGHFVKSHSLTKRGPLKFLGPNGKLAGIAPNGAIDAGNADAIWESAEKLDSLLRQANVEEDFRKVFYNQMIQLDEGDYAGLMDVTSDALDFVGKRLGGDVEVNLKGAVRQYGEELEAFRKYGVDSWGNPIDVPYAGRKMRVGEDGDTITEVIVPTPQITSELNSLAFYLPDVTELRRAATKTRVLREVYTSKGWEMTADAARSVTRSLFKPLAILRPAYILRIGAEEQARLAAAGYDSVYNHPFRWLMANVTNRNELKTLTGDNLVDRARALDVITKDAHGRLHDKVASRSRVFGVTSIKMDDAGNLTNDAYRGWRGELGQLAAAQEARKMAELRGNLDEFKTWAQTEGLESITKLSRVNDEAASLVEFGDDFDAWAEGLARRVQMKTGGVDDGAGTIVGGFDEDLIQRIVDQSIPFEGIGGKAAKNADAAFHSFLSAKARKGIHPGKVKIEHVEQSRMKAMDTAVDWLFDQITGKPTSRLARFPTMRQAMIRRGEELMDGLASDALRRDALEAFTKNLNLTDDELRRLAQSANDARGTTGVIDNLNDFDEIIVGKAAQDAKDLLFDVTKRGAGQDAMVAVLPFLDAWKEVSLTWVDLLKQNPAFFIRAQAGYKELRDQGTFYVNDHGQEVFRYPGGGMLATFVDEMNQRGGGMHNLPMAGIESLGRVITGDTPNYSVSPEGSVSGLNMVATGVGPGFGPIVQWGATVFDTPDTRKLREFIAPFGTGANDDPEDLLNFGGVLGSLAPAWMRKAVNAVSEGDIDERQWNSMVGDSMAALAASGDYDPSRDADRLLEDAERYAYYQLLFRGGTQFLGPTGPTMSGQVEVEADTAHPDWDPENDPTGRMFFLGVMQADYHRLTNPETGYGYDVGAEKFYEMYGIEPFFVTQAKTSSQGRELPVTQEGDDWMQANRDLVDDMPLVAGFFAPVTSEAKFDFSAYSEQLLRGDRKTLSPKEQQALATKARARAIWSRVQQQAETLPPRLRDSMLANAKGQLEALHPGWQTDVIVQPAASDKIAELQRAADDPRLDDNPLSQPLREYMALRDSMLRQVRVRSGSPTATLSRKDAALERRQLMAVGLRLAQQSAPFMGVWSGLLKNELSED